ncbi:hypothetical protein C4D60_Mb01t14640 [Musa balbisiana]|uniref:GDSL esterase/lipase n=1 Tax=Musa balbisiana TaxID=52838 RepID=A0A4S8JMK0_MUSBA|nr:hypothetical protein C4D60_Mb01t14640 [Musa balbisiana]
MAAPRRLLLALGLLALGTLPLSSAARAFFVFGDSLVDNGNNNYLATTARADTPPYGIDTPSHRATGRFSNGKNVPDIVSEYLGAESTLPYLSPELHGERLLVGANFASAGIGILNDTGIQFRLYELGSRRVLVTGIGPLGCVPAELALRSRTGACDPELQRVPDLYNPQLTQLLSDLNTQYGSSVFVAVNAYKMHMDFITNPGTYGFITSRVACCGQGPYNGIGLCTILSNLCPNRNIYAFWDAFHPTEKANRIIVSQFMTGPEEYMSPMNLSSILAMDART